MRPLCLALVMTSLLVSPAVQAQATLPPPPPPPPTDLGPPPPPPPPQIDPQPDQGQPYPGQPYPGQPYPGQAYPASGPPMPPSPVQAVPEGVPANTGFQLFFSTGASLPLGKADANSSESDVFGPQVPIRVDLGYKPVPLFFVGGYLGLAVGGPGSQLSRACSDPAVSCTQASVRLGVEAQVSLRPRDRINPYVGYGIGLESTNLTASVAGQSRSVTLVGPDYGRFTVGADYRFSSSLGVGPYVDLALGRYDQITGDDSAGNSTTTDIASKALHGWLTFGVRVTLFP